MCAGIAIGPLQLKIVDDPSLRDTNFPFWATTLLSYVLEVILPPDPNILSALKQENQSWFSARILLQAPWLLQHMQHIPNTCLSKLQKVFPSRLHGDISSNII